MWNPVHAERVECMIKLNPLSRRLKFKMSSNSPSNLQKTSNFWYYLAPKTGYPGTNHSTKKWLPGTYLGAKKWLSSSYLETNK